MHLINGDSCQIGQFVVVRNPNSAGLTFVTQIHEILHIQGSIADLARMPDGVLLQTANVQHVDDTYHMPLIKLLDNWSVVQFEVSQVRISFKLLS